MTNGKNFYITTTLPYVNADPHIGFALEIIQADVIARYHRQKGDSVFFNTGVDEHGLKIYRKAQEEGLETKEYCDIYARRFDDLKKVLNLSYNSFIRTTDKEHIKIAQEFWLRCQKNGDIYMKNYKIKYCVGCELEKTNSELVKGKCPFHPDQELETIEEENYFFRYSKYEKKLLALYKKNPQFVLPAGRLKEIKEFTKKGLKDFSISRLKEKMPWGVPVPGDNSQIMYVWFDALVNYISCLGWPNNLEKFSDFWPGFQIAGKDNLRQQSSMWQAMLMSAGLPTSKQILIHGFVSADGQKMSKSLGNVVDPFDLVKEYGSENSPQAGTDAVRYFLLREFSPFEDGDYTSQKFEERYNFDLANGLGNLVARVLTMAEKVNPKSKIQMSNQIQNPKFKTEIDKTRERYKKFLDDFKFNESLMIIWELISFCDKYIEKERPWENTENKLSIINNLLIALTSITQILQPFLPGTSEKIIEQIKSGKKETLFPRIETIKN